jgi:uncharacterized glyoxalase superfamily protein PhnB
MPYNAQRITPVLVMKSVEPSLDFWERRLGFTKTVQMPETGAVAFAILVHDGTEVMLSSEAAARADMPQADGSVYGASTCLFIEVSDLEEVARSLEGYPIAMPRRRTFYGMDEIGVVEPGGHWVTFAQPVPSAGGQT